MALNDPKKQETMKRLVQIQGEVNLRNKQGEIIVSHDQLIPVFFQLAEALIEIEENGVLQGTTFDDQGSMTKVFVTLVSDYAPYLQEAQ